MKGRVSQGNSDGSCSQSSKQESKSHGLLGIHYSIKHFRKSLIHVGTFCHCRKDIKGIQKSCDQTLFHSISSLTAFLVNLRI